MNERIAKLTALTLSGQMYAEPTKTLYDEEDLTLPKQQMLPGQKLLRLWC